MRSFQRRRAAITGVGIITALGRTAAETWLGVREGRSALRTVDLDGTPVIGAPAPTLDDESEPNIALALHAADEALADATLTRSQLDQVRCGCTVSSSKGGMRSFFRMHRAFLETGTISPEFWGKVAPSAPGSAVAAKYAISGPLLSYAAACATGVHSVIAAARIITSGEADIVLAGATDASLVLPLVAAFDRMGVLSRRWDDPQHACRPFDRTRDGFGIGEGAAVMVLESDDRACFRAERVYAYVSGTAWGADAYDLTRVSTGHSAIGPLLGRALADAGRTPRDVDYVNLHGTGTRANDPMESAAIREALGGDVDRAAVSSLKPAIGHLLGAAGGVELALTLLAMRDGFAPPTLNLNDPDPECRLNHVANVGIERKIETAVKISAGFGGHIGIVVLDRGDRSR